MLTLDPPPLGPFDQKIKRIDLQARWSKGFSSEDAEAVEVRSIQEGITLNVGKNNYRYRRSGVERNRG